MSWIRRIRRVTAPLLQGAAGPRTLTAAGSASSDKLLLAATLALTALGLVMIYSITAATSGRPTAYLESQGTKVILGIVAFMVAARIDYHRWGRWAPWLFLLGLALLGMVFVPGLGHEVGGARRWIRFGPQTLQPIEFARLGFIVYLAFLLSKPRKKLERFSTGLLPCLVALVAMMFPVLLQPNLSTVVALTAITGLMLIAGRVPWKHLGIVLAPLVVAIPLLGRGYQSSRIENWLGYWFRGEDLLGGNYQLHQSIVAIGSGGLTGQGLGGSRQKWSFLPDAHTDFVFAILGEELGLIGALAVMALLLIVIWRAYTAARRAPDEFGTLLAIGIGTTIAVYGGINIFVATGLFPTTGLPLPLVSFGGSAVLVMLFSLGILANIAAQAHPRRAESGD